MFLSLHIMEDIIYLQLTLILGGGGGGLKIYFLSIKRSIIMKTNTS